LTNMSPYGRTPSKEEMISTWDTALNALTDSRLPSGAGVAGKGSLQHSNFLFMDGPDHKAARSIISGYFKPSRIDEARRSIDSVTNAVFQDFARHSGTNIVQSVLEPIVLAGIFSVMAIPEVARDRLAACLQDMLGVVEMDLTAEQRDRADRASLAAALILNRVGRDGTGNTLVKDLSRAVSDGMLPVQVARTAPVVLLHGGYENPLNMLGCIVDWASKNPNTMVALTERDTHGCFEHIVRTYSPVKALLRHAQSAFVGYNQQFSPGHTAWISLKDANHDETRFPVTDNPLPSGRSAHLGFGHGAHKCLGIALARAEGYALIKALSGLDRGLLSGLKVRWRSGVVAHGPESITF
jgi:cytochrome P450